MLVRPFLDEVTVAKIQVLGSGYKGELLKQIDEENLPYFFGGTCRCKGDDGRVDICSLSDAGPWNLSDEPKDEPKGEITEHS